MDKIQRIVVAGVLINSNQALIVRRSLTEAILPGIWELPSGKVEFGEHPSQALRREFFEETGLEVDVILPYDVFHYTVERKNNLRHTIQVNYLVNSQNLSEVVLSEAHSEYQWINLETLEDNTPIDAVLRNLLETGWRIQKKIL
jgi:8-oxo-dGTP diphosphatase